MQTEDQGMESLVESGTRYEAVRLLRSILKTGPIPLAKGKDEDALHTGSLNSCAAVNTKPNSRFRSPDCFAAAGDGENVGSVALCY